MLRKGMWMARDHMMQKKKKKSRGLALNYSSIALVMM